MAWIARVVPGCFRGDLTSPEPSMSPQHPHRARGPRGWMGARARIVMNESTAHTRARSTSRRVASTETCARFLFHPIASSLARVNGRSNARARIRRIATADRTGGRSAARETVSSRDGRARRWNSRVEVLSIVSSRFRARTEVARARSSIRFDSIDSRLGRVFIHSGEVR